MKYILLTTAVAAMLLCACNNHNQQATKNIALSKADFLPSAQRTGYAQVETWIDDFKNFRTAMLNKDEAKLETYFSFPLETDSSDIWMAVLGDDENIKQDQTSHKPFTKKDFKQYHQKLFTADFLKALLKIKSAKLHETGDAETHLFKGTDGDYRLYANYDKQENLLTLNLAYAGGKDEDGNYISESEHNINYLFTVSDNKYLRFKGLFIAG